MSWDFSTEPEFEAKLAWMRDFVRERVEPLEALTLDEATFGRVSEPLKAEVRAKGLWAAHLPRELGGQGYGQVKLGLMHEIIGRSWPATYVFGNQPPDSGNSEILARAATEEQREKYLYPLLAGEKSSAFAMTEFATACSDPTLLECRARLEGDEWIIEGEKWFITRARHADFFIVMVVTDPNGPEHRRASQLIVDAGTPGLYIDRDIPSMLDPSGDPKHLESHAAVRFARVRVPASNLLGKRGDGFRIAQERLGPGRIHHCMRWIGQAQRAFDMLCERATYRVSHGSTLSHKQTVQNWIADSSAEISALRLMTLQAAWMIDHHGARTARQQISTIKYFGAKVVNDVIDRALQAHGALGYSSELPLEWMARWARAARLYDGPDEVHRQTVARLILRGYSAPADGVPTEYVPRRRASAEHLFAAQLRPALESQ